MIFDTIAIASSKSGDGRTNRKEEEQAIATIEVAGQ